MTPKRDTGVGYSAFAAIDATNISTKFENGPTRPTQSMSRRGLRILFGSTGTGFAHAITGMPVSAPMAGRMIEPTGSMCGIGFSVSRPASFAVWSPNQSATTPWLISCRITATIRQPNQMADCSRSKRLPRGRRAGHAEPGRRHGLEPGVGDLLAAGLALPVACRRRTSPARRRRRSGSRAGWWRARRPRPVRRSPGPSRRSPRRSPARRPHGPPGCPRRRPSERVRWR